MTNTSFKYHDSYITLLIIFLSSVLSIHPTYSKERDTIRVVTEATYPPFEYIVDDQFRGIDIDIITEILKGMNRDYTIVNSSFDSFVLGLESGKYDIAIGTISVTESRKKVIDFTIPYLIERPAFISYKATHQSLVDSDLSKYICGIQKGTTFDIILKDKYKPKAIKYYDNIQEAYMDLRTHRIDLVLGDSSIIRFLKKKSQGTDMIVYEDHDPKYATPLAIAVKKGNKSLLSDLNNEILRLKSEGTIDKITDRYLEIEKVSLAPFFIKILISILNTLKIALIALFIGLSISVVTALLKIYYKVRLIIIFDVLFSIIRSLPELFVITFSYYAIPIIIQRYAHTHYIIDPTVSTSIGLGLIFASYGYRLIYHSYQQIDKGQIKVAEILGLSRGNIIKRIVLPQIYISSFESMNNLWLILIKDTSILSLVGISEIMYNSKIAASSSNQQLLFYSFAGLVYLVLTLCSESLLKLIKPK